MPSPRLAFAKAVALKSLELAVRFWPEESRHWGQALLAETHAIAHPAAALFWALGGATVFLRSHFTHLLALLKLPPGRTTTPLPIGTNGPRFPHNSRLVTSLILLAIAVLLLLPAGREATSIVSSSWRDYEATPRETRVVERLAAKAEKDRDARQLAFLASCEPDPERAEKLADHAVELDPALFWIYTSRYRRPMDPISKEWLARLRASDPDNAFVYMLTAEVVVDHRMWSKFGSDGRPIVEPSQIPGFLEWSANMQRALQAPHYDSYGKRQLELTRKGWQQSPEVPVSLVQYSLWSHRLPGGIQEYVRLQILEAQRAAAAGHVQKAEETLQEIADAGQRLVKGSETDFERFRALEVARSAQYALQELYVQSARHADEQLAADRIHLLEANKENLAQGWRQSRKASTDHLRKRAVVVQASAWSALGLAVLTFLSLILLEVRAIPWQRFRHIRWTACRLVDFGPSAVLVLAGVFLFSFRPFALALDQYRSTVTTSPYVPDLIWQLMALDSVQTPLRYLRPQEPSFWIFVIVALSLIAAAIVVRAIWRHIASAHHA